MKIDNDIQLILACFSGEDGGVSFAKLRCLLADFEKRAENGDDAAEQILLVVHRFAKLIQIAQQ
jgi:hypothetical protein